MLITAGPIIGTATGAITGNRKSPEATLPGFFSGREKPGRRKAMFSARSGRVETRLATGTAAVRIRCGILQRGHAIFFTLTFEFLLRGSEGCHALYDFFAFQCEPFLQFGHAHPCDSCRTPMVIEIGARLGRLRCGIVLPLATDSSRATKIFADVNEIDRLINQIERGNRGWWISHDLGH
jgi:hypothetical protein